MKRKRRKSFSTVFKLKILIDTSSRSVTCCLRRCRKSNSVCGNMSYWFVDALPPPSPDCCFWAVTAVARKDRQCFHRSSSEDSLTCAPLSSHSTTGMVCDMVRDEIVVFWLLIAVVAGGLNGFWVAEETGRYWAAVEMDDEESELLPLWSEQPSAANSV